MNYSGNYRNDFSHLPSYSHQEEYYSKTYKPKKTRNWEQLQSSPVLRVLVLLLALAGLAFTFHSSAQSSADPGSWVNRRKALEQEQEPKFDLLGDERTGAVHPPKVLQHSQEWANRRVTTLDAEKAGEFDQGVATVPREGFNPQLHQMYLDLPSLREATPSILTGSWQLNKAVYDYSANHPAAKVLSWENPRVVLFKSFLSPDEVQHLISMSTPLMVRSEVLSNVKADGTTAVDDSRTSYGAWPPQDDVMKRINGRIHRLLALPDSFGEGIYVLRYQLMQQYQSHHDNCMGTGYSGKVAVHPCLDFLKRSGGPDCGPGAGGPTCGDRVATFILYLKHPKRGGSTVFPSADITKHRMAAAGKSIPPDNEWYCKEGEALGVSPSAGDAVLFWNYVPGQGTGTGSYGNGTADPSAQSVPASLHSGCPVLEGEKWIATRWIRSSGFDLPRSLRSS